MSLPLSPNRLSSSEVQSLLTLGTVVLVGSLKPIGVRQVLTIWGGGMLTDQVTKILHSDDDEPTGILGIVAKIADVITSHPRLYFATSAIGYVGLKALRF